MDVCLANLAARHFDLAFKGTKITSHDPVGFIASLETILQSLQAGLHFIQGDGSTLHVHAKQGPVCATAPGYAPFCKHLFVRNFTNAKAGVAEITEANVRLLHSGYVARRPGERAVLTRWFERADLVAAGWDDTCPWLDLVLYSQEQMSKEGQPVLGDWAIVSINSAIEPAEAPMPPITMMRNALGVAEGGSGVVLDDAAYNASVAFWDRHATVL